MDAQKRNDHSSDISDEEEYHLRRDYNRRRSSTQVVNHNRIMAHKSCIVKMSVDYSAVPNPPTAMVEPAASSSMAGNWASAARRRFSLLSQSRSENRVSALFKEADDTIQENAAGEETNGKGCTPEGKAEKPEEKFQGGASEGIASSTNIASVLRHKCSGPGVLTYHSNPQDFAKVTNDDLRPQKLEPRRDVSSFPISLNCTAAVDKDDGMDCKDGNGNTNTIL